MPPKKLQLRSEQRADATVFRLDGPIDENVTPALQSIATIAAPVVVFNFKDTIYVNSSGLRSWVIFLREFVKTHTVAFEECSPTVVSQMNMLPAFHGKAVVRSVFVPVVCGSCRHVANVLVPNADFPAELALLKKILCPKCAAVAEPTNVDDDYFSFTSGAGT